MSAMGTKRRLAASGGFVSNGSYSGHSSELSQRSRLSLTATSGHSQFFVRLVSPLLPLSVATSWRRKAFEIVEPILNHH